MVRGEWSRRSLVRAAMCDKQRYHRDRTEIALRSHRDRTEIVQEYHRDRTVKPLGDRSYHTWSVNDPNRFRV